MTTAPTEGWLDPCPTCDGNACEEGCGGWSGGTGCQHANAGPDSHRICRRCDGSGAIRVMEVAECDRRVDAAVKAERDRCVTAIRDAFTKYAGLGRQWERDAVRAALAAIEHPDATGDTPRSTP